MIRGTSLFISSIYLFYNLVYIHGQSYDPLVATDKLWSNLSGGYGVEMEECCHSTYFIKCADDTILQANNFIKVFLSNDSLQTWIKIGYIREEDEKVYFVNLQFETGIIYDFGVNTGDTIHIRNTYYGEDCIIDLYVTSIDTINVMGIDRHRINLTTEKGSIVTEQWITGIGSIYGTLYTAYSDCGPSGRFRELLCVYKDDIKIYHGTKRDTCYISENVVINNYRSEDRIIIFPNPVDEIISFKHFSNIENSIFKLYTIHGQFVYENNITDKEIDIGIMSQGIYYYKIIGKTNNSIYTGIIIKE